MKALWWAFFVFYSLGLTREVNADLQRLGQMFGFTEPNRCPEGDIRCANGRCILESWRCDGMIDCQDGSDEQDCPIFPCTPHQHSCGTRRCIPLEWRCDGRTDCLDGSDENVTNCMEPCPDRYWKCQKSQMCIPLRLKCDGTSHCPDREDEAVELCSSSTTMGSSFLGVFKEQDGNSWISKHMHALQLQMQSSGINATWAELPVNQ